MLEWVYDVHNIYLLTITRVLYFAQNAEGKVKGSYSTFYVVNIVAQAIFTLIWYIFTALVVGWLFTAKLGAPRWLYVPLIIAGVFTGLISMVRFILAAMRSLERLEEQDRQKKKLKEKSNGKQK